MKKELSFIGLCFAGTLHAFSWQNFWETLDQRAQNLMGLGQFDQAEKTFLNDDWQAAAAYRAGHFETSAKLYASKHDEESYYNQGNALARMGQYEKALKAYDAALAINPKHEDALYNRKIVEELLKKDKQQQEDKKKQEQEQEQQEKENQEQKQEQQDKEKQQQENQSQQPQDKKDKESPSEEQKNEEQKESPPDKNSEEEKNSAQKPKNQSEEKQKEVDKSASKGSDEAQEQQQTKDQWLRLIPDDPGGLLREKFLRDHIRRRQGWDQ